MQCVKNQQIDPFDLVLGQKSYTFADMNSDFFHILLLCFVSGFTQCALIACSVFMYKKHRDYQFQRVFAAVLLLHSFGFMNNFVVAACESLPFSDFLNTLLLLYDYLIVGGYMMFVVSLVFPSRFKTRQLLLLEVPYLLAIVLFAVTQNHLIYNVVQFYTLAASFALLVLLWISIKKHTAMLRDNVGDLEHFDLRWCGILITLYFIVQLVWALESASQKNWFSVSSAETNLLFDTLYCFLTIIVMWFVMQKIIQQQVFIVPDDEKETNAESKEGVSVPFYQSLVDNNIDGIIRDKRFYQDNTLTLQKLAQHLSTNRQYLSNYINQEKHVTFYNYINDFRLEEAKSLLDSKGTGNRYSLEDISMMAGFNSYATFLRSFKKKFGQTPSQYLGAKE